MNKIDEMLSYEELSERYETRMLERAAFVAALINHPEVLPLDALAFLADTSLGKNSDLEAGAALRAKAGPDAVPYNPPYLRAAGYWTRLRSALDAMESANSTST